MPRAEVTVTAYGDQARGDKLYEVTTTETGTFSVFVPTLSGSVYLDAKPQDDYGPSHPNYVNLSNSERYVWFDHPANRPDGSIAVIPGQVLQFGTFTGNSVQPRITGIKRVVIGADDEDAAVPPSAIEPDVSARGFELIKGEPTDTVEVTWAYETRTAANEYSAAIDATVVLQTGGSTVSGTVTTPDANDRGTASDGTTVTHERTSKYQLANPGDRPDYGEIDVRVQNTVMDSTTTGGSPALATSASVELAGVASSVTGLTVDRDVTVVAGGIDTHFIDATWSGPGSPGLEHRISLYVRVEASSSGTTVSGLEWVVFQGVAEPGIDRATDIPGDTGLNWGKWSSDPFDINLTANAGQADDWQDDDDPLLTYTVTLANLRAATHLRIDTKVDGGDWVKHASVAIPGS